MSLHKEELENEQNTFENEKVVIQYSTEGKVVTKKSAEVEEHDGHDHEGLEVIPFVPHHALKEAVAAIIFLVVIIALVAIMQPPMDDKANPFESPLGVLPEWYFLAPFELLHLMPPLPGMGLTGAFVGLLVLIPFLDRNPRPITQRRILFPVSLLVILVFVVLSVMSLLKAEG